MRIKSLRVKNFMCFKDISLSDLGDFVILIGENDSGKTALLDALRFLFVEAFSSAVLEGNEYLFFGAIPEEILEITFEVILEISNEDRYELQETLKPTSFASEGDLSVCLKLIAEQGYIYRRWQSIKGEGLPPLTLDEHGSLYFHTEKGKESSIEVSGQRISAISVGETVKRLLGRKFKLIPVVRERPLQERKRIGERPRLLPEGIESKIIQKGRELAPAKRREWYAYRDERAGVIGEFDVVGDNIVFEKSLEDVKIAIPISLKGGGHQMYLYLRDEVEDPQADIIAIEEPENHFHPKLIRQFMEDLKRIAQSQGKQFFIITHSPFVASAFPLFKIWYIWQEKGESKISRITSDEEYRERLLEIGVTPGDLLFSNVLFFVEGPSELEFLPRVARKLGMDFKEAHITVIPKGGLPGKDEIELLNNMPGIASIPKFFLLDRNAEGKREALIKVGIPEENIFVLSKGNLEDYYPCELIKNFLKEYEGILREKPEEIPVGQTVEVLRKAFPGGEDWWKVPLARFVGEVIQREAIDKELSAIIEKVHSKAKLI